MYACMNIENHHHNFSILQFMFLLRYISIHAYPTCLAKRKVKFYYMQCKFIVALPKERCILCFTHTGQNTRKNCMPCTRLMFWPGWGYKIRQTMCNNFQIYHITEKWQQVHNSSCTCILSDSSLHRILCSINPHCKCTKLFLVTVTREFSSCLLLKVHFEVVWLSYVWILYRPQPKNTCIKCTHSPHYIQRYILLYFCNKLPCCLDWISFSLSPSYSISSFVFWRNLKPSFCYFPISLFYTYSYIPPHHHLYHIYSIIREKTGKLRNVFVLLSNYYGSMGCAVYYTSHS